MAISTILCVDGSQVKLNYNSLPVQVGQFWSAWDNFDEPEIALRTCVIAGDEEPFPTLTAVTQYNSCYECLVNNYTIVYLEPCDSNAIPFNPIVPLSEIGFLPTENQVLYLELTSFRGDIYLGCFQVTGYEQASESFFNGVDFDFINQIIHSNFSLENGCNECLYGFLSGTESTICEICCPCTTGETVNSVSVPHPNYSNGQNQSIIQLNAITIGGFNGLNN
jgi:hypothetical protein